jgi:hypothetical protein
MYNASIPSTLSLEAQGGILFGSFLLCATGLFYFISMLFFDYTPKCNNNLSCLFRKLCTCKKKKQGLLDSSSSEEDDDEEEKKKSKEKTRKQTERDIDKLRSGIRSDQNLQKQFMSDLG